MKYEVILTESAHKIASEHLLSHFKQDKHVRKNFVLQFGILALEKVKQQLLFLKLFFLREDERNLHGNTSFLSRIFSSFITNSYREKKQDLPLCIVILLKDGKI